MSRLRIHQETRRDSEGRALRRLGQTRKTERPADTHRTLEDTRRQIGDAGELAAAAREHHAPARFGRAFPDYRPTMPTYLLHSLGEMDGGTRDLGGSIALLFGADMIARYHDAASIGPYFTSGDDPRITRVGRFLRRSSIDELPQLFNVLRGDMSLVGPRPDVAAQQALYEPGDWALRCSVRPGITGLAQAQLRSEATPEQRLALDLDYARNHGVLRDLCILAMTVRRLGGRGSN